jgi:hypothetical protein
VARGKAGHVHAAYEAKGLARREAAAGVTLEGARVETIHEGAPALDLKVLADGDALAVEVRGVDGAAVRWVADVELVEVQF